MALGWLIIWKRDCLSFSVLLVEPIVNHFSSSYLDFIRNPIFLLVCCEATKIINYCTAIAHAFLASTWNVFQKYMDRLKYWNSSVIQNVNYCGSFQPRQTLLSLSILYGSNVKYISFVYLEMQTDIHLCVALQILGAGWVRGGQR